MTIRNKVSIVTGGARGIGRACAMALATRGCAVALVDVFEPECLLVTSNPCYVTGQDITIDGMQFNR